jgi:uncharacterized iron-regulated membrane protein
MVLLRGIHRWTGALIGLLLAAMGLSGAILAWKDYWIGIPGADANIINSPERLARATEAMLSINKPAEAIVFGSDTFGLHRLYLGEESGAYANSKGQIVESWSSIWERPEVWMFDFHHHLFAGEFGETVAGMLALIGLGFVITGSILWWRVRKTFQLRLWPKRMTQNAIVRHHRDLGIVFAPLLILTALTGAVMTLKPVANLLLSPFSSAAEMKAALAPPQGEFAPMITQTPWQLIYATAQARFPDAQLRVVSLPGKTKAPITIRMKQPGEWLPNGRTMLWFAGDGSLIEARSAYSLPTGVRLFNTVYPLHAGKVGGVLWTVLVTLSGIVLTMLGVLTSWSFWRSIVLRTS